MLLYYCRWYQDFELQCLQLVDRLCPTTALVITLIVSLGQHRAFVRWTLALIFVIIIINFMLYYHYLIIYCCCYVCLLHGVCNKCCNFRIPLTMEKWKPRQICYGNVCILSFFPISIRQYSLNIFKRSLSTLIAYTLFICFPVKQLEA